jgi:hypothetical protein
MPNKRAEGRTMRAFSLPDNVYLRARDLANRRRVNLSAEVERFLVRWTNREEKREREAGPMSEREGHHGA